MSDGAVARSTIDVNDVRLTLASKALNLCRLDVGGERWFDSGPHGQPIWSIHTVNERGVRVDLTGSAASDARVEAAGDGVSLAWDGVVDKATGAGPFEVRVSIQPYGDRRGFTAWRIAVDNRATDWTLWHVVFPDLPGLLSSERPEADRFFYPDGWGIQRTGWSNMAEIKRKTPTGWNYAMQFGGFTRGDSTLYLGVHDPELTNREFILSPGSLADIVRRGRYAVTAYPEGMSRAGNDCRLDFDTVLGVIPGDWYDAARIYAGWARQQPWATHLPSTASREPGSARDVQAWHLMDFPGKSVDELADGTERVAERLGVKLGVHVYNWHETPFDTNYPEYFPARAGFRELVTRLKLSGIVVMPYINARIWDINAASWQQRQAERYEARGSPERLHPRTLFSQLEEYGSGQKLAPMCPTTPLWQDIVVELCRRIVFELGCNGIYLDQVGAAEAKLCFNPDHSHPVGGGGYWLDGYHDMMEKVRATVGPEVFLTTECNWEGCIADFDALLMWHSFGRDLIPLFPAVYSGLAVTFGVSADTSGLWDTSGEEFAFRNGQLFLWGGQPGWSDLTQLLDEKNADVCRLFASLCRLRQEHVRTFAEGHMLRPPVVETGTRPTYSSATPSGPLEPVKRPYVLGSLWQKPGGDEGTLFLLNHTRQPAEFTLRIDAEECAGRRLGPVALDGVESLEEGVLGLKGALPPLTAVAVPVVQIARH